MIKVIIADSSPLIALALINKLDLLPKLYSKIIIPNAVWDEVTVQGKDLSGSYEVSQIKWAKVQTPEPILLEPLKIMVDRVKQKLLPLLLGNQAVLFYLMIHMHVG